MKAFATLLKLAGRDLETLRRALGDQLRKQTDCEQRMREHEQTILSEQALARRDYESARAYGGYAMAALMVRQSLEGEHAAIGQEMERLRTQIAEAHVEVRKFERLIELEAARVKATREKREDAELDEMGTMRHGRR